MDVNTIMIQVVPYLMNIVWLLLGAGVVGALGYYLLIIKRRKQWHCNIWETKVAGNTISVHRVDKDILVARKFNKGKQTAYIFRKSRTETMPPSHECIDVIGNKLEANYLRLLDDFIPFRKEIELPGEFYESETDIKTGNKVNKFILNHKNRLDKMKGMSTREAESRYVYIPIDKGITGKLNFVPIDYDINMMRINAIDNREKIYKDKESWMQQYGTFLAMGGIIVLIIVVLYFSYDYSASVIDTAMSSVNQVSGPLQSLVERLNG